VRLPRSALGPRWLEPVEALARLLGGTPEAVATA